MQRNNETAGTSIGKHVYIHLTIFSHCTVDCIAFLLTKDNFISFNASIESNGGERNTQYLQ